MQNEAEIDRRACVAIDRLVALHGKSFDVQAVRAFVALHAYRPEPARERGTNPNAKLTAANAKLTATVADLETRLQSATARATMAETGMRGVKRAESGANERPRHQTRRECKRNETRALGICGNIGGNVRP
jgi:hypothetical protein